MKIFHAVFAEQYNAVYITIILNIVHARTKWLCGAMVALSTPEDRIKVDIEGLRVRITSGSSFLILFNRGFVTHLHSGFPLLSLYTVYSTELRLCEKDGAPQASAACFGASSMSAAAHATHRNPIDQRPSWCFSIVFVGATRSRYFACGRPLLRNELVVAHGYGIVSQHVCWCATAASPFREQV